MRRQGIGLGMLLLSCAAASRAGEDPRAWKYQATVTVNASLAGVRIQRDQIGFPLPIRLRAASFAFDQARADGADVRFAKPDGTPLAYQIERWDKAQGKAEIWVRIDTVHAGTEAQTFLMRWGNADAADASDPAAVFRTTEGYAAVWHLQEQGNTRPAGYRDATGNGAHGQGHNMLPANTVEGIIGPAQVFHPSAGGGQSILIDPAANAKLTFQADMTLSHWIKVERWQTKWYTTVAMGNSAWRMSRSGGVNLMEFCNGHKTPAPDGKNHTALASKTVFAPPAWHLVTAVSQGRKLMMYVDGNLEGTGTMPADPEEKSAQVAIGQNAENNDRFFDGEIDEVQLLGRAVDADWVQLAYATQRPDAEAVRISQAAAGLPALPRDVWRSGAAGRLDFQWPAGTSTLDICAASGKTLRRIRRADWETVAGSATAQVRGAGIYRLHFH